MSELIETALNLSASIKKNFETAEIAKFTPDQRQSYEDSLKYYRDLKNSLDTAKGEGIEIGVEIGKLDIAKKALKEGLSIDLVQKITGFKYRSNRRY